jgi:hypothetical protein
MIIGNLGNKKQFPSSATVVPDNHFNNPILYGLIHDFTNTHANKNGKVPECNAAEA